MLASGSALLQKLGAMLTSPDVVGMHSDNWKSSSATECFTGFSGCVPPNEGSPRNNQMG